MAGENNEKISSAPLASDVQADDNNIPATPITPGAVDDNQLKNAKVSPTPASSDDNNKQSRPRSERQREASRVNGKQSRGPVTERGKSNSKFNALKHGILSRYAAISHPSESPEEFQELLADLLEELKPVGRMEGALVELIAVNYLRLGRATRYETAQLNKSLAENQPFGVYIPHCGAEEVTAAIEEVEKNGYFSDETREELIELKTIPPGIFSLNARIRTARAVELNVEDDVQLLLGALRTELGVREHFEGELYEHEQLRRRISVHQLALPAEHEWKKIRRYQKPVLREIYQALEQLRSLQRRRLDQEKRLNDSSEWHN